MYKRQMYSVLTVTDIVSETNTQKTRNSMIGSVKKNGLTLEKLPDGFRATFEFPEYSYTIPMDFILVGEDVYKRQALSALMLKMQEQPLDLDYITVSGMEQTIPNTKAGFFQNIAYHFKAFIGSFFNDYT